MPGLGKWFWITGDLLTGRIYSNPPLLGTSWSNVMDDAGTLTGTAKLADPKVQALNLYSTAAPCKTFLAVGYEDATGQQTLLEGGPIWTHQYDDTTGDLTIGAAGLWTYFDHRKVEQILATLINPATFPTIYAGLSLGTIAKRLVQLAQSHTGGNLPIVLPGDVAVVDPTGQHDRTYNGYDLAWVGTELRNLTGVIGGPEIAFRPSFAATPGFIQWTMVTGTEADPLLHQAGADWTLDNNAQAGALGGVSVAIDGTSMGDEAWVKGNGDAEGALIGHVLQSTLTSQGYALFEVEVTGHDSTELVATLNGYASAALASAARPTNTFTLKLQRDQSPSVAQYQVGDYVKLLVGDNHRYYPPGLTIRSRIVQRTGDDTDLVSVQLAPVF